MDEATARLGKHDQLSLADPGLGGAVEEYYDEYTEALRQAPRYAPGVMANESVRWSKNPDM